MLDVLRLSPDFRPAHDPLLGLSTALAETNPAAAPVLRQHLPEAGHRLVIEYHQDRWLPFTPEEKR